jgi:hypothetical protein
VDLIPFFQTPAQMPFGGTYDCQYVSVSLVPYRVECRHLAGRAMSTRQRSPRPFLGSRRPVDVRVERRPGSRAMTTPPADAGGPGIILNLAGEGEVESAIDINSLIFPSWLARPADEPGVRVTRTAPGPTSSRTARGSRSHRSLCRRWISPIVSRRHVDDQVWWCRRGMPSSRGCWDRTVGCCWSW